ncbi:MAG: DUF2087 domain-containing protein [Anaerolineaceae bacterium]|nr:MAG: DUF2087 domain-containing protein [Anaerolineaceae bacterium]
MENKPEMLDFVKAMSDVDRLRIIGLLTKKSAPAKQVADELRLPFRDAFDHLSFLAHVGVIRETEETYQLVSEAVDALARNQFAGRKEAYVPAPDLDAKARKVLVAFLNPDGSIRQIPSQPEKLKVILNYLVAAFTPGVDYTEKEVNTILRRFNVDVSGLRRDLIDSGLMARESNGSRYWRL